VAPLAAYASVLGVVVGVGALSAQNRPVPPGSQDHDGRGALAVLRRDGVMMPFASFDRDSWRVTWPISPQPQVAIPITRDGIPKEWWGTRSPDQWLAYLTDGREVFLDVTAPAMIPTFCGRRLGVRTNYQPREPLPPVRVDPFPKDGLVISGGVPLEPIETMNASSAEWTEMAVALLDQFNEIEDEHIRLVRTARGWRHPFEKAARKALPVRLESWYRSPSSEPGWTVSYVEAVRQYPPRAEDKNCGLETLVSGWVHHQNGTMSGKPELRAKLTYCDRVGATFMLPFGRIRPRSQPYWVFQLSGWESEWYEVVSTRPDRIRYVIEVLAGAGQRCFRTP
jgi:hypothetical protein